MVKELKYLEFWRWIHTPRSSSDVRWARIPWVWNWSPLVFSRFGFVGPLPPPPNSILTFRVTIISTSGDSSQFCTLHGKTHLGISIQQHKFSSTLSFHLYFCCCFPGFGWQIRSDKGWYLRSQNLLSGPKAILLLFLLGWSSHLVCGGLMGYCWP